MSTVICTLSKASQLASKGCDEQEANMITVVESRTVERDYGFNGTEAVLDHPKHGRVLLCDGYGGENGLRGGAVRWSHGIVVKLQPGDTLKALHSGSWNECCSLFQAVVRGYDHTRPVLEFSGHAVAAIASKAGL